MTKKLYINNLINGDAIFGEVFAVKAYKKGATRNNKPFVDIELSDNTGSIKGKIWSDDLGNCDTVKEGDVVEINGTVEEFMGKPQLKITNLKKTDKFKVAELQQKSDFNIEEMWQDVEEVIKKMKNPHLVKLLHNIFKDSKIKNGFKNGPAAYKLHHAYIGGLLEHTWEMLKMAQAIKNHFPKINMDLVNTGIVLHDIGKIEEFEMDTTIIYKNKGKLLGHVFLGTELVKHKASKDMPEELLDEVLHIILSHHGERQFGSPTVPMTAEAMTVYVFDLASSRVRMTYDNIHGTGGSDEFTQYIPQLGTELYRSPYLDSEINTDTPF